MRSSLAFVAFGAAAAAAVNVPLVTFDGAAGTTFKFAQLNDPVMGGKSRGTWAVHDGYGTMAGDVVDVPSLKAPGFIKASADGSFADASAAVAGGLRLKLRSSTADYKGFRVSFAAGTLSPSYACAGGGSIPLSRGCFKAQFDAPKGNFTDVYIPFSQFSDKWSPATGEQTTTCAEDSDVCPTAKALAGIKRVEIWAEGADGHISIDVESIAAVAGSVAAADAAVGAGAAVPLVTFDGTAPHTFSTLNDPVMGGKSSGTWTVQTEGGQTFGTLAAQVVDVPKLMAPGFVTAAADGTWADASSAIGGGLRLTVRSKTDYKGWRVSFAAGTLSPLYSCAGGGSIPLSRGCFKANFDVAAGDDFVEVTIPFNKFSDKWDPKTGEQTTTCADESDVCPTAKSLAGILRMEIWAEGVDGDVAIDILRIDAVSL
eukprot:TRINITY_DN4584_c0_g1_i1.p2 TRINITY_DN4584_c0_g1~~TRINITY_DN4584_c0_g1_i1.p2  ORF type:complete len:428 (+),score=201.34 TRINITY_DN4584_c0_g1_i1:61-1344(+)